MRFLTAALCAFGLLVALPASGLAADGNQPNVLFTAVDDLRPQLACYGQSQNRDDRQLSDALRAGS